jgi:nitrite reductase/ring-hydroxylating ferredoxin subunit
MPKLTSVNPTAPLTQSERLARKKVLREELSRLEARIAVVEDELKTLLARCDHTDANGRTAVVGGRTKVCAHCGKTVSRHSDKLWQ